LEKDAIAGTKQVKVQELAQKLTMDASLGEVPVEEKITKPLSSSRCSMSARS
jgi:hypothetical protein